VEAEEEGEKALRRVLEEFMMPPKRRLGMSMFGFLQLYRHHGLLLE
jgi:hypothetical protein